MAELRLDGYDALAAALGDLQNDIERTFDNAASRSAVATAEAAAARFKDRDNAASIRVQTELPVTIALGSSSVFDTDLSHLDAIEAAVMSRQEDLLVYLTAQLSPLTATGLTVSAAPGPHSVEPSTQELPSVVVGPLDGSRRGRFRHTILIGGRQWVRSATILGWFGLVILCVAVFLLSL